jgi:CPA1 family monovalent cation:H+ antiporter
MLPARMHTRLAGGRGHDHAHLSGREIVALSWSGTRGVITLAAAFSLPLHVGHAQPFPGRDLLLFCAYLAVLLTLVAQGLTFAPLLHSLGFREGGTGEALLRNQARTAAVQAALARLDELAAHEGVSETVLAPLRQAATARLERYTRRADRLSSAEDSASVADDPYLVAVRVRRSMIAAERDELLQWRDTGRLSDRSLRMLMRELDHEEGLLPPT